MTSKQRSLFLESLEYAVFDLTAEDTVLLTLQSTRLRARVISGRVGVDRGSPPPPKGGRFLGGA